MAQSSHLQNFAATELFSIEGVVPAQGLSQDFICPPAGSLGMKRVVGDIEQGRPPAPVVWLLGKVQSGKSSIVRTITQASDAEIGSGFKACTRTSRIFAFPTDAPILRFLDTRGLGEAAYDPAEDLAFAEQQAHLLLVTMRALDLDQTAIVDVVSAARRRNPAWPIIVAQTCLHEGYPRGQKHAMPYPFTANEPISGKPTSVPPDLLRCLEHQKAMLRRLPGQSSIAFVPIDFTTSADGMPPSDYGLNALFDALLRFAPDAMRAAIAALPGVGDDRGALADPLITRYAMAAAGSDLAPVVGAFAVSAIQARLLQRIAQIYGVSWDRSSVAEFATALGSSVVTRTVIGLGLRQLTKLIPVYGQTVGAATSAATSFAVTFALGRAAVHFLTRRQRGLDANTSTAKAYQEALARAIQMTRDRMLEKSPSKDPS